jgi:hypothetical protein
VYIGNILALLRLHPAILERIEKLQPGGTGPEVTERWLRPIARLPHAEQLVAVAERLDLTSKSGGADRPRRSTAMVAGDRGAMRAVHPT